MPTCLAASTTSVPFGTVTSRPLIVTVTSSSAMVPWVIRAPPQAEVFQVLVAEVLHGSRDRAGGEVAQGAQHLAADLAGQRQQQVEIGFAAAATFQPKQDFVQPTGALAAGGALAARLVAEELLHPGRRPHDADA